MTGRHDYPELVSLKPPVVIDQLANMALRAHPASRAHRAKWIRAVRYLRKRHLWVLDDKTPPPRWRASQELA